MKHNIKELIKMRADNPIKLEDKFDDGIIGVNTDGVLVYDADIIIEVLEQDMMVEHCKTEEPNCDQCYNDATEFFYYNIEGTQHSGGRPIYIFSA